MSRNYLPVALLLAGTMVLGFGCKKPPEPEAIAAPPPPPPPPPTPPPPPAVQAEQLVRVSFGFDSSALTMSGKSALQDAARILKENGDVRIEVQGHCDERGSTSYNMALGQRRANTTKKYLKGQGVAPSRLKTVSYGEERPLATGSYEGAWDQNRRCEFVVLEGNAQKVKGTTQ